MPHQRGPNEARGRLRPNRNRVSIPSQAERRFLLRSAAAEGYVLESWNVPGGFINAPNDPRFRVTMNQPPLENGSYKTPGNVCVLRRVIPGDPRANALLDTWRYLWLSNWRWSKVLAEPSMVDMDPCFKPHPRMKWPEWKWTTIIDEFLVTALTPEDLDILSAPLRAWKIKIQKLAQEDSISTIMERTEIMPIAIENYHIISKKTMSLQHVGQKLKNCLAADPNKQP